MEWNDTICAPATVPGTGAITVIRVSGPEALAVTDRIFRSRQGSLCEAAGYTIRFGAVVEQSGDALGVGVGSRSGSLAEGVGASEASQEERVLDDVLVSVFRAPHSYTGEDSVELSCHASSFVASRLLALLCSAGARLAEPGEFTRRAFVNGKMDLAQAEAVADVISSTTSASHRVALTQMKGGFSRELAGIRDALVELTSLLELELDFSEEEVEFADRGRLRSLLLSATSRIRTLADSFHLGNAIKSGVPVAIVGEPNVGKSTLLNALVGDDRALVSDIAGTTRDSIEETVVLEGIGFRFIDTAGLRESDELVERMGIDRTWKMLSGADLVLALVDATRSPDDAGCFLTALARKLDWQRQQCLVLVNKVDANKNVNAINKVVSCVVPQVVCLEIVARDGRGLDDLRRWLVQAVSDRIAAAGAPFAGRPSATTTYAQGQIPAVGEMVLVTNTRHHEALRQSADALDAALTALDAGIPSDLIAQDLRTALHHLGTITGTITTDEVLGQIFGKFCIGK